MPSPSPTRLRPDRLSSCRTYFANHTWLTGARLLLTVAFASAALAALAVWAIPRLRGRDIDPLPLTHGRLAAAHAAWDGECAACHQPHPTAAPAQWLDVQGRWRDFTCNPCHSDAPHYVKQETTQQDCAGCHRDHGGRGHSLTRLHDSDCVRCHGRLTGGVEGFVTSHPEFRALGEWKGKEKEKRRLKFSHSLHMTPGIAYDPKAEGLKTAGGQKVQLRCESCHRLDSERQGVGPVQGREALGDLPAEPLLPPRAAGAYMLPVTYDQHCKACHPLLQTVGDRDGSYQLTTPHRVQPAALVAFLKQELTAQAVGRAESKKPGGLGGRLDPRQREALAADVRREVAGLLEQANRGLYNASGTCAKCHVIDPVRKEGLPPRVDLHIPTVWFARGRFSHTAHRALSCAACHPGKDVEVDQGKTVVRELEPLGIDGIDSCRDCHRPREQVALPDGTAAWRGGVRHGCTDCHSYHNGANPLQGRGARGRDPGVEWPGWESWLRGQCGWVKKGGGR